MLFNSYVFIFAFLPFTIIGYWLINKFNKKDLTLVFLTVMSLVFYGYFNISYVAIIVSSICVNYILTYIMRKSNSKKLMLILGIVFNVALIFYFKYYDFFVSNINIVFSKSFNLKNIMLPLGISFFTFQQLSYVVDSYNGETNDYSFIEYAAFVSFFPQLIAGPIVLHSEIIPQFRNAYKRSFNADNMARGLYMFAIGLAKKVLIADTFGKAVDYGFQNVNALTSTDAWIVMLSYTIQIYFDFSGYCDMASGIANMFNMELPINFDSPYKSTSIIEFWKRWHITLTRFLRKYVYFPLGGNRKGSIRTYVNILVVFFISGVWHGANWTFIIWGLLHGIANVINRLFAEQWKKLHVVTQWVVTFVFVNLTWVIFRADTIKQGIIMLSKILLIKDTSTTNLLMKKFNFTEWTWLVNKFSALNVIQTKYIPGIFMCALFIFVLFITLNCTNCQRKDFTPSIKNVILTSILLVLSVLSLSGISTFLYFNF